MATSLTQELASQLQGQPTQQIAQQLGIDPTAVQSAVGAALPLLVGALGRNASSPQGAQALFGALQNDHASRSGVGDLLGAVLGGSQSRQTDGAGILGHVLGGGQQRAEQAVGQATGIGQDKAGLLLRWLAPIVLGYLAKQMFDSRQASTGGPAPQTDQPAPQSASSPDVLGKILGQETKQIEQQGGPLGNVLGQVLDRDGDGDTDFSDLLKIGSAILGGRRGS